MKALLAVVSALIASTSAFAGSCEDGEIMARSAAANVASKQVSGCHAVSALELPEEGRLEVWKVEVKCPGVMGNSVYKVRNLYTEDAVCYVNDVTLLYGEE